MRKMTTMVYSFNELSEAAQERALNAFRCSNVEFNWWEDSYDTIRTAGKLLGLEIGDIHFDAYLYCIFDAHYRYVRGAVKAVRNEFPRMTDLHEVARDLQALQRRYFYSLRCNVASQRDTNSYQCFRFGEDYECEDLGDIIDDFAHWARVLLRDEYKYLTSDEAVKEAIEANEHEFTEAGKLV